MKITSKNRKEVLNSLKTLIEVRFDPEEKRFNVYIKKVTDETKGYYIIHYATSYDPNIETSYNFACDYKLRKSQEKKLNKHHYFEITEDVNIAVENMRNALIEQDYYSPNRIKSSVVSIESDIYKANLININGDY